MLLQGSANDTAELDPGEASDRAAGSPASRRMNWRGRSAAPPKEPLAGVGVLRRATTLLLMLSCLVVIAGAMLVLLLWQQDRTAGLLTSQIELASGRIDDLQRIERYLAFAVVPVATAWVALATINVGRATGRRRDPVLAVASVPVAVFGVWVLGHRIIAQSTTQAGKASGLVLQLVALAIPLLALERVAVAVDARRAALRAGYVIAGLWLGSLEFLTGLSSVELDGVPDRWSRLGAHLIIAGLLQILGVIAVNEAARSIEDGTENRYQLRTRFGERATPGG